MADKPISYQEMIDMQKDAVTLKDAVNGNETGIVTPRLNDPYPTLPAAVGLIESNGQIAIQKLENTGGFISAPTLTALQAITPEYDYQLARVDATGDEYRWNPALTTPVKWEATGRNFLSEAKVYVDEAIKALPIMLFDHPDFSVCIKDKNGQLALGLLLKKDGTPHQLMIDSIYSGMIDRIAQTVADKIGAMGYSLQESSDGSFFIVDKNQQMSYLGVTSNGLPHPYTIKCIKNALLESGFSSIPTTVKSTYQNQEIKAVSGPNIVCWGDSMTAGAGGNGTSYPVALKNLLVAYGSKAEVFNAGVGGETSVTITARQGGNPFIISVDEGVIPAAVEPIKVTIEPIDGQPARPLLQGVSVAHSLGILAGIEGSLALVKPNGGITWDNANYYTFTRTKAGAEVAINRPAPFYLNYSKEHLGDIHIIWIGQNGPSTTRAISDAKAIIQRIEALSKRFIVISKPTSTDADDSLFFAEFGVRFIPIRKYMIKYGLSDANIEPTAQDLTDISNGIVPTSLRSDAVHWTAQGYTILGNQIFKKLIELGWV